VEGTTRSPGRPARPGLSQVIPDAVAGPVRGLVDRVGELLGGCRGGRARDAVLTEIGIPPEVLPHLSFRTVFDDTETRGRAGRHRHRVPEFRRLPPRCNRYWREHLTRRARRPGPQGQLDGRTVMITGASSGIGRETALRVAAEGGSRCSCPARRGVEKVRAEIEEAGGRAGVYSCDITDADSVGNLVSAALADHGQVDMLVNTPAGPSAARCG